ncbi:hypothetical protein Emtol_3287 [Emticicia oligotrophica DSM 17448]|uniref:Right handed beta helix domain-containing protein n=1 Tax=Emticicia oligotrophica (strain DSM 17448 / CIP 109782 / MTCC 6937 / GPTSA100-15) TaxID=929562 RepID=A0ABM5N4M1_EMTOG|nr:hypothetical protein [Emticicia oligotrophica]AFK04416.1 hypothetical protein Emtol_3287 [Emticicia oligotrophica DSM 17448]
MRKIFTFIFLMVLTNTISWAQATRTWVSGVGDDANPCSRTAPCKTFAGAISKTAAGGEISVLDPGGYGAVTITKSITINGDGTLAGIINSGTNGIVVNAGATDIIVIRSISINGFTTGLNGIRYLAGGQLHVENCAISGFTTRGIDASLAANGILTVENTTINGPSVNATGIYINTTLDTMRTSLTNVRINGVGVGVDAEATSTVNYVSISNSNVSNNSIGIRANNNAQINIESSNVSNNDIGIIANNVASIVRLSNVNLFNNSVYGVGVSLGKVISFGNNSIAGNAANQPLLNISKQ